MKALVVYFSRTGCVAELAEHLRERLEAFGTVTSARIAPVENHGYLAWLARSFVPRLCAPIHPVVSDLDPFDVICLGFPKWTMGCPPLNQYLREMKLSAGKRVGIFMSYGGFDQQRYLRALVTRISSKGAQIGAVASIKRSMIRDGRFRCVLDRFCRELLQESRWQETDSSI